MVVCPSAVAERAVGAPGAVAEAVVALAGVEAEPVPTELIALTR